MPVKTTTIRIFDYTDYRKYLLDYYSEQKKRRKAFSYRFFAHKAGVNSIGLYKDIVEGRQSLGRALILKFSAAIGHNKKESEYFETMVYFCEARSVEERKAFFERMMACCDSRAVIMDAAKYEYYSKWYYSAIRALLSLIHYDGDAVRLASMLIPAIRPAQAAKAIEVLKRLGLIRMMDGGGYALVDASITTGRLSCDAKVQAMEVINFQRVMCDLGRFSFTDLPQGQFNLRIVSTNTAAAAMTVDSVRAQAGDTTIISPFAGWPLSRRVYLNTSATGAGVADTVYHFPVVVRLTATDFDFSTARSDGADIRFTKNDGTTLPYEIEMWDSTTAQAVIWVAVDTIRGDTDSQFIVMRWGNAAARTLSNAAAVFDTAYGFRGVWHLDEDATGTGTPGLYRDATAYAAHGADSVLSAGKQGIVGRGQEFDGSQDYIPIASDRDITDTLTVSAWIRVAYIPADTVNRGFWILSNFGRSYPDSVTTLVYGYSFSVYRNDYSFIAGNGAAMDVAGAWDLLTTEWMHLAVQWEQGTGVVRIFENGVQLTVDDSLTAIDIVYDWRTRTTIGTNEDKQFQGSIDEIELSATRRSPAWIRLCYENQRPDQTLVHF